ncbi:efflux RND transporter periplasmic adaptor subunit [Flagellimonas sp.]|uniref:efflux RND transporter periplasmic adaptor subunit n=1 Tax=Flagellimonas sp. TaxID=2058762 RepID=UPI003F4A47B6
MEYFQKYKNYFIAAGILIVGILIGSLFSGGGSENSHKDGEHEYVQDPETQLWTCSMHPQIKMEKPGNCPICGMELIPLEESDASESIASNEIVMTEEAIQLANIQTTVVKESDAAKEIHLLGRVKPDERLLFSQVSHIPGRIERLYVNFTGEKVYAGQKIVRIYSPELISAQKELFETIKSKEVYPQLYAASRNKLKLWKLSDAQIDAIEKSGKVQEQIDILSDHSGYVMQRNVELGNYIMEGQTLFEIANLSTVWVMFEAYESDIPWINIDDKVTFAIQALPGKTFTGKVTYVDPFVSSSTRVAKVRVEVKNPNNKLLPEMYANGRITAEMSDVEDAIIIPKSSVLWTGKRAVVYVKVPHERTISFVFREIELGADMGDYYIVESGLEAGEVVATNGVFRIDASAQLVGQKSMMNPEGGVVMTGHNHGAMDMGDGNSTKGNMDDDSSMDHSKMETKTDHSAMDGRLKVSETFKGQLENVFDTYLSIKDALVKDNGNMAKTQAAALLDFLAKVDMKLLTDHGAHDHWMTISKEIKSSSKSISETADIEEQRGHFKHLSAHLSKGVRLFGVNQKIYEQFCPMADNNKGAYWLSLEEAIQNPYMGGKMLTCGTTESTIDQ